MSTFIDSAVKSINNNIDDVYKKMEEDDRNDSVIIIYTDIKDSTKLPVARQGALVDLSYVVSHTHLEASLCRVRYNKQKRGHMSDGAVRDNIYYSLSSTKKMAEAQKKYMISESTTCAAYLLLDPSSEYINSIRNNIMEQDLAVEVTDPAFIGATVTEEKAMLLAGAFKLSPHELKIGSLEEAILMKIAVKEVV